MKKVVIYLTLTAATLLLAFACITYHGINDEDDSNGGAMRINEKIENGDPLVDIVTVSVNPQSGAPIGYGKCENGRLLIDLPTILPDRYLRAIWYRYEDRFSGVFSDKNAKSTEMHAYMYGNSGNLSIDFELLCLISESVRAVYEYYDRDLTVKGTLKGWDSSDSEVTYDCAFKKGWNLVYVTGYKDRDQYFRATSYTTQKPSHLTFGWFWRLS